MGGMEFAQEAFLKLGWDDKFTLKMEVKKLAKKMHKVTKALGESESKNSAL